jgi:hypothetical protein
VSSNSEWVTRGKTIRQLIQELSSFDDQDLEVRISVDGGETHKCISLVGKRDGKALLSNYESTGKSGVSLPEKGMPPNNALDRTPDK